MTENSVFHRLREKIVRNEIEPGARVSIDGLVRELGVSQTPVREALKQLEGHGLVTRVSGRGYATTPLLDEPALRALFEVRLLIEPWAAKIVSIDRATNPGAELLAQIDRFAAEKPSLCARIDLVEHDMLFHETIQRATGNAFLCEAYEGLHAQLHLFRLYDEDVDATETLEEHRVLARAISECRADAAESAMREHLSRALRRFLPLLGGDAEADVRIPDPVRVIDSRHEPEI